MNWQRAWQKGWREFRGSLSLADMLDAYGGVRTALFLPVIVALLTVVLAIAGFLLAWLLQELGIVDLVRYDSGADPDATARTADWLRWTLVGYVALAFFIVASTFGSAWADELRDWNRAKEELRRQRR